MAGSLVERASEPSTDTEVSHLTFCWSSSRARDKATGKEEENADEKSTHFGRLLSILQEEQAEKQIIS